MKNPPFISQFLSIRLVIALAHGGGGHKMASGLTLPGSLDNVKSIVLNAVKEQLG